MSASKAQINWASVSWDSVNITRVTSGGFGQGGKLLGFKGDNDVYPVIQANVDNEPHATFTSADVFTVQSFVAGTSSTLSATLLDAFGQSAGNIAFTMVNAVFENADSKGDHAQYGTVTGTWKAYSSDGTTNPLSFTQ